ncbi:MAG: Na+/H+ antiporter NhaC family protein [Gemmatimonadota bacterium]|nr:MAG: Na+/H+ antiporter NhaC family protein [Gemmatimonadota bacterium]
MRGVWIAALITGLGAPALQAQEIEVDMPSAVLRGIAFTVRVAAPRSLDTLPVVLRAADGEVLGEATLPPVGEAVFRSVVVERGTQLPLSLSAGAYREELSRPLLPGWFSLLPPLLAIALALMFHEVVSSLFLGVWLGCLFLAGYNPFAAFFMTVERFVMPALADPDHASIVVFSLLLGGMVGVMSRLGGTRAIVNAVSPLATSRRRGQLATWLAGIAIFFDDYANTLIVGNTMRPLTDRLRISREKLAYIVDSTAAPVTVLVFVSTWVGFEIGLIGDGLRLAAEQNVADPALADALATASPFGVFIHTIPFLFYPILAVFLVGLLLWTGRDFGPMLAAERRAVAGGGLYRPGAQLATDTNADIVEAPEGTPLRWWNGAIPVVTVVVTVVIGLVYTGYRARPEGAAFDLSTVLGYANPFSTLLWGSLLGSVVAIALGVSQRIVSLSQAVAAWAGGLKAMIFAMVILVLAWSLGEVTNAVGTAPFLASALTDRMPLHLLPVTIFLVAALISFATGTSWGTMAILLPLAIPLAVALGGGMDFAGGTHYTVLLGAISSVMAGSIFGDHCSPISDTTVLSSTASGCDHVDHVRTQLPYAVLVAVVGMTLGDIPTAYGMPPWISLLAGIGVIWLVVRFVGRPVEAR